MPSTSTQDAYQATLRLWEERIEAEVAAQEQAEDAQLDMLLVQHHSECVTADLIECGLLPVHPYRVPDLDLLDWDEWGDNLH